MTTWHVEPGVMERYARGRIDVPHAFSLEKHLESCEECRLRIAGLTDSARLDRVWSRIAESVAMPERGFVERVLVRLGVQEYVARLLAATPALTLSWFVALAAVLSVAIFAAYNGSRGYLLFLVITPLLPVAGVAASYGPGIDPTYELGIASPMQSFRLLLIRSSAVLATTTLIAGAGALLLPGFDWRAAAWLLPSLGLVVATLALATITRPLWAACIVTAAWIAVAGGGSLVALGNNGATDVFGRTMQSGVVVVTGAAALLLLIRRDRFETGDGS